MLHRLKKTAGGASYIETGAGEAVFFIHGCGEAAQSWPAEIAGLAAGHRLIAADLAGLSPSDLPDHLRRLLDDLAIAAVSVVARGDGAVAAIAFTLAHPLRVRRLALIAPPPESLAAASLEDLRCPVMVAGEASQLEGHLARISRGNLHPSPRTPAETGQLLGAFLSSRLSSFDPRELRTAFGTFMTGVTIVTTAGIDGQPRGFTANSFTSLSIEPPLLLICIGKAAASREVFETARGFAVNILSEHQKDTSVLFASKRPDKFQHTTWRAGPFGNPLIDGAAAWFDCARHQVIDAGDHIILIGHIEAFSYTDANPLGYARGGYITLGLEQAAVNAASSASRTIVGAIIESDNRLVLLPDHRPNGLSLPEVGRTGASGSASRLHALLAQDGIDATLGFLFAVFENPGSGEQCIYYRGEALLHARGRPVLASFDDIPWDRLPDEATRSMLRRYAAERKLGRFKVYSGDHRQGTVKAVE
jgi:flavin reductase (DIM6/NTAB) family NADH-FMN oxidoreductase RutF